jgi:hypothetical protein
MRNDKISEKVFDMMEHREEIFERRRRRWLQYGRALLTVGVLGLLTVALYAMTHSNSKAEESARIIEQSDELAISYNSEEFSEKIKIAKRAVRDDKMPKSSSEIKPSSLNDVESDNELDADGQHLKIFRRQQSNGNNVHRHSDNGFYVHKGYKCVPIRKPTKQLENIRARHRVGMCCLCLCAFYSSR